MSNAATWKLRSNDAPTGFISHAQHQGNEKTIVDVGADWTQPNRGWQDLKVNNQCIAQSLLGASSFAQASTQPQDAFHRDGDLFANYGADASSQIQSTLYWRLAEQTTTAIWQAESILSLQTDRLDASISPAFVTELGPDLNRIEFKSASDRAWSDLTPEEFSANFKCQNLLAATFGWKDVNAILCIAFSPGDSPRMQTESTNQGMVRIHHTMPSEFLEKGVIRRYRIGLGLFASDVAANEVDQWYDSFVTSAPPLTV